MVHEAHWERLLNIEPGDVQHRSEARYDPKSGCYALPVLDRKVEVDPIRRVVRWRDEHHQADSNPGFNVSLLAVVYLISASAIRPTDEWVTPESLPGGAFFFRGPHTVPTTELAERFGHDRESFLQAADRLGGKPIEWGDAGVQIQVLPRIAFRLVLWLGDDEFPARITMLVDRLVSEHLPLDVLWCMMMHVASSLLHAGEGDG